MQQSSDAAQAVLAFYERMGAGDVDGAAAWLADDPDTFVLGTRQVGAGRAEWLESVPTTAPAGLTPVRRLRDVSTLRRERAGGPAARGAARRAPSRCPSR